MEPQPVQWQISSLEPNAVDASLPILTPAPPYPLKKSVSPWAGVASSTHLISSPVGGTPQISRLLPPSNSLSSAGFGAVRVSPAAFRQSQHPSATVQKQQNVYGNSTSASCSSSPQSSHAVFSGSPQVPRPAPAVSRRLKTTAVTPDGGAYVVRANGLQPTAMAGRPGLTLNPYQSPDPLPVYGAGQNMLRNSPSSSSTSPAGGGFGQFTVQSSLTTKMASYPSVSASLSLHAAPGGLGDEDETYEPEMPPACGDCSGCHGFTCGQCLYCRDDPRVGGAGRFSGESCVHNRCLLQLEHEIRLEQTYDIGAPAPGCQRCTVCRLPDCGVCGPCLDQTFFSGLYFGAAASCRAKRCPRPLSVSTARSSGAAGPVVKSGAVKLGPRGGQPRMKRVQPTTPAGRNSQHGNGSSMPSFLGGTPNFMHASSFSETNLLNLSVSSLDKGNVRQKSSFLPHEEQIMKTPLSGSGSVRKRKPKATTASRPRQKSSTAHLPFGNNYDAMSVVGLPSASVSSIGKNVAGGTDLDNADGVSAAAIAEYTRLKNSKHGGYDASAMPSMIFGDDSGSDEDSLILADDAVVSSSAVMQFQNGHLASRTGGDGHLNLEDGESPPKKKAKQPRVRKLKTDPTAGTPKEKSELAAEPGGKKVKKPRSRPSNRSSEGREDALTSGGGVRTVLPMIHSAQSKPGGTRKTIKSSSKSKPKQPKPCSHSESPDFFSEETQRAIALSKAEVKAATTAIAPAFDMQKTFFGQETRAREKVFIASSRAAVASHSADESVSSDSAIPDCDWFSALPDRKETGGKLDLHTDASENPEERTLLRTSCSSLTNFASCSSELHPDGAVSVDPVRSDSRSNAKSRASFSDDGCRDSDKILDLLSDDVKKAKTSQVTTSMAACFNSPISSAHGSLPSLLSSPPQSLIPSVQPTNPIGSASKSATVQIQSDDLLDLRSQPWNIFDLTSSSAPTNLLDPAKLNLGLVNAVASSASITPMRWSADPRSIASRPSPPSLPPPPPLIAPKPSTLAAPMNSLLTSPTVAGMVPVQHMPPNVFGASPMSMCAPASVSMSVGSSPLLAPLVVGSGVLSGNPLVSPISPMAAMAAGISGFPMTSAYPGASCIFQQVQLQPIQLFPAPPVSQAPVNNSNVIPQLVSIPASMHSPFGGTLSCSSAAPHVNLSMVNLLPTVSLSASNCSVVDASSTTSVVNSTPSINGHPANLSSSGSSAVRNLVHSQPLLSAAVQEKHISPLAPSSVISDYSDVQSSTNSATLNCSTALSDSHSVALFETPKTLLQHNQAVALAEPSAPPGLMAVSSTQGTTSPQISCTSVVRTSELVPAGLTTEVREAEIANLSSCPSISNAKPFAGPLVLPRQDGESEQPKRLPAQPTYGDMDAAVAALPPTDHMLLTADPGVSTVALLQNDQTLTVDLTKDTDGADFDKPVLEAMRRLQ